MGTINIIVPPIPTNNVKYGPYDVTDYLAWQSDLSSALQAGSSVEVIQYGSTIIFNETRN